MNLSKEAYWPLEVEMRVMQFLSLVIVLMLVTSEAAYSTNYALLLDGTDDHVSCGIDGLPLGNEPRTIEAWFRTESPDGYQQIVGYGTAGTVDSALALFTKGGSIVITQWGASVEIPLGINDGEWHHGAVTHDGENQQTVYVDGELVGNWDRVLNSIATTCTIGSCLDQGQQFFNGAIDEARIWDVERTEDEIRDNINISLKGDEPHLVSYWKLDEGEGKIAHDSAVAGNDGEINNDPEWIESDAPVTPASVDAAGKLATTWAKVKRIE